MYYLHYALLVPITLAFYRYGIDFMMPGAFDAFVEYIHRFLRHRTLVALILIGAYFVFSTIWVIEVYRVKNRFPNYLMVVALAPIGGIIRLFHNYERSQSLEQEIR